MTIHSIYTRTSYLGTEAERSHIYLYFLRFEHENVLKDGAYYCYCAYVQRISRYWGFLLVELTNARVFLRGLKVCGESRT